MSIKPNKLKIGQIFRYPNAREIEKTAHKRYAEYRLPQTEYFKLNQPPEI